MSAWRWQPPARSPASFSDVARAIGGRVPGEDLTRLIVNEYGARSVVLCASGTAALNLALRSVASRENDIVAIPAFGCYAIASAAVSAHVRAVLYDVSPHTLGPDWNSLGDAIALGATSVVIAPQYGIPVDWMRLRSLIPPSVTIIEDAAQSNGAEYGGRPVGSFGEVSILSFGRGKGWTGGSGGALLIHDEKIANPESPRGGSAMGIRSAIYSIAQLSLGHPNLYRLPASLPLLHLGETNYRPAGDPRPMDRFAIRLAIQTAAHRQNEVAVRRLQAEFYREQLANSRQVQLIEAPADSKPGWIRYPIRIQQGHQLLTLRSGLRRLGAAPSFPNPLHLLADFRKLTIRDEREFPGAVLLASELITLPTHDWLTPSERSELIALIKS